MTKHRIILLGILFLLFLLLPLSAQCESRIIYADQGGVRYFAQDGLLGLMDNAGNVLVEPIFEMALPFIDGVGVVKSGGKFGAINQQGTFVVPCEWEYIARCQSRYGKMEGHELVWIVENYPRLWMRRDDLWGLLTLEGQELCPPRWVEYYPFYEGISHVEGSKGCNYMDLSGNLLWAKDLEGIRGTEFSDGLCFVFKEDPNTGEGLYNITDLSGRLLLKEFVAEVTDFTPSGVAAVKDVEGMWRLVDRSGNLVKDLELGCVRLTFYDESLFSVHDHWTQKWGLMDATGRLLTEPSWDYIEGSFVQGFVIVMENDQYGLMDTTGRVIAPPTWDNLWDTIGYDLFPVKKDEKWGLMNAQEHMVVPLEAEGVWSLHFAGGLAAWEQNGKIGYINPPGGVGHFSCMGPCGGFS